MNSEQPSRRAVLAGASAVAAGAALSGCAVYGKKPEAPAQGANAGKVLAQTGDIPVGGGKVLEADAIVVTQPQQGMFKAFTAVCTHQGCTVNEVKGGTINCPCHGSKFNVADGSVANGPAAKPLPAVNITVDGTSIKRA